MGQHYVIIILIMVQNKNLFTCISITILPAKSDSDIMFRSQCYQGLLINRSYVY